MPKERQKMSLENRAKQFAPFDSLKGLQTKLRLVEYEHERIDYGDISEDKAMKISDVLSKIDKNTIIKLAYINDGHKFIETGNAKLDIIEQYIEINKKKIELFSIYDVDIVDN